jgi:DnaA family protein
MQQLLINDLPNLNYSFEAFYIFNDETAFLVDLLQNFLKQAEQNAILIQGNSSSGTTHLLHSMANLEKDNSILIDLEDTTLDAQMLYGLDEFLICFDNLDNVIGKREWEEAIFALYNAAIFGDNYLLFASKKPLQQLNFVLPDLKSRLSQALSLNILPMNDRQKIAAILHFFQINNIKLPSSMVKTVLNSSAKDLKLTVNSLMSLNNLAWQNQQKLNKQFVKNNLIK